MKPYFSHDENARNDPKLIKVLMRLGQAGKGVYWDLVEMLYEQNGYLLLEDCESHAFALRTDCELITKLVNDFELFATDGTRFWSETCLQRMEMRDAKKLARAEAGAKGGKIKAEREAAAKALLEQDHSNASQNPSIARALLPEILAIKRNEIKGNERKEDSSSLRSGGAAYAAAPPHEKKIEPAELSPLEANANNDAAHTRGAAKKTRFSAPNDAQVLAYFTAKRPSNLGIVANEAARFMNHYQSNGWRVGKNPMRDWEASCRNWLLKVPEYGPALALPVGQQIHNGYPRPAPVSQVAHRQGVIEQVKAMLNQKQPIG